MPISLTRDQNGVVALGCALNTDGVTVTAIKADPSTHLLNISDGTTGSDNGVANAVRDANQRPVLMATSSVDGRTPVEVYADSSGNLLVDST